MVDKTRGFLISFIAVIAGSLAAPVFAQDAFKDKTLTFIVGYSPGGTYDQYTRLVGASHQ